MKDDYSPPHPDAVAEFAREYRKKFPEFVSSSFDAYDFCEYYASNAWIRDGQDMKVTVWRRAVRSWLRGRINPPAEYDPWVGPPEYNGFWGTKIERAKLKEWRARRDKFMALLERQQFEKEVMEGHHSDSHAGAAAAHDAAYIGVDLASGESQTIAVIKSPHSLTEQARENIINEWQLIYGRGKAPRLIILENGLELEHFTPQRPDPDTRHFGMDLSESTKKATSATKEFGKAVAKASRRKPWNPEKLRNKPRRRFAGVIRAALWGTFAAIASGAAGWIVTEVVRLWWESR